MFIPLIIICAMAWQTIQAIEPFDYDVRNWWDFYLKSNFSMGPDSSEHTFYKVKDFENYEKDLSLLVQEIYRYIDAQPDVSAVPSQIGRAHV